MGRGTWEAGKPRDREGKEVSQGERPDEAQGCRVMGKNEFSHDHNTPGARIGQGCHPIKPGVLFLKGMGCGNALGG